MEFLYPVLNNLLFGFDANLHLGLFIQGIILFKNCLIGYGSVI